MRGRIIVGSAAALVVAAIYAAPLFPGIYLAFKAICHQAPDRCFRWLERPMPVCARCLGVYTGVLLGALFPRFKLRLFVLFGGVNGLDWLFGFTNNEARFLVSLPLFWLSASYLVTLASRQRAASN
jgi:uncharacterized membrane protein